MVKQSGKFGTKPGLKVIKLVFMLNSTEHTLFILYIKLMLTCQKLLTFKHLRTK